MSVLKVLPKVIRESVDAEQHADFKKGEDGVRSAENGINPNVTIHRLYGAVRMDGKVYRVKVTLKENVKSERSAKKAYSYEATKIELLAGTLVKPEGDDPNTNNSVTAANLLKGVEKSYGGGKFFEDYNKVREQFIDEQGAEHSDHVKEVSTRLDNLSVAREMENDKKDAKTIKLATGWERGADGNKWGFDDGRDYKYKNVENNRKLNDLVTRDDNGEIIPPSKRFDENVEDVRYRTSEEFNQINQKFNERLDELVSNPNQKDKVLHLGRSSEFLKDGGISDAEIVLDYDKLARKSKEGYKHEHPFDISDVRDLPRAIASPIAVFDNTNGKNDGKVILTELKKDGRNFIVAIQTANLSRKGGKVLEVNKIVTLFPKDARGVINWFIIGKATNIDKKKALHFIEALLNHPETTITNEELSTAAKVVKDFGNSQIIPVEKSMHKAATDLAQQLHVEGDVEILTTTEGLTGRQAKAKGWYDVKTGRVTIVLPNNKNATDVRETVFHEVVAHKGLRNLVGEEHFNTFLKNRLLTNLSSTEVSRLLSVVNNVHGKKDIKNYVQKVLDMMVGNQVSNLNHALTNLLLFKGKKVNAQGVEIQGKLDLDGQRMAEVVWNGIGLTDEVFTIESTQVQNRATITRINRAKPCMYHQLNATAKAHL